MELKTSQTDFLDCTQIILVNSIVIYGPPQQESFKQKKSSEVDKSVKYVYRFGALKFQKGNRSGTKGGRGGRKGCQIILGKTAGRMCCVDGHTYVYTCTYGGSRVLTTIRMCPCLLPVLRPRPRSGIQCNKTASPLTSRSLDRQKLLIFISDLDIRTLFRSRCTNILLS